MKKYPDHDKRNLIEQWATQQAQAYLNSLGYKRGGDYDSITAYDALLAQKRNYFIGFAYDRIDSLKSENQTNNYHLFG